MIATRQDSVCVKLKQPWMGNPSNTVMRLPKRQASSMFQRDAAELLEAEQPEEIKKKLQRRDQVKDKMIKSSQVHNKSLN
jgi:hypothetical protein